ncbi:MAG: quinohemoprotein ethanol dehydrogenase, partial [Solirubrobacteraceae bacterium]|nr:quinohemoprotein ethanol dehydrogenase [Solirubrobacteraceae bacterium]
MIRGLLGLGTAAALAVLALGAGPAGAAVGGCAGPAAGGDWPFYGGTFDNHREQLGEKAISTANVSQLGLAWQLKMPDAGVIQSTPTVADGCVYTGTDIGDVYAVNADTGKVVWSRLLQGGGGNFAVGAGIIGAPAIANGLVYVAATKDGKSILFALDQATGAIVWTHVVDSDAGGGADSSPIPYDGLIFQAYQGDESSTHSNPGFAIIDGSREGGGRELVHTKVIPDADFAAGDRGGSIVDTPAYDPAQKIMYVGTGNPASPHANPRTDSLLKIDADPASPTF